MIATAYCDPRDKDTANRDRYHPGVGQRCAISVERTGTERTALHTALLVAEEFGSGLSPQKQLGDLARATFVVAYRCNTTFRVVETNDTILRCGRRVTLKWSMPLV